MGKVQRTRVQSEQIVRIEHITTRPRVVTPHITPEQSVFVAQLIVHPVHNLLAVLMGRLPVYDLAAGVVCLREAAGDVHRCFTEQRRIDPVVDEWSFQCDLPAYVA